MISLVAYRMFVRPHDDQNSPRDATYAIGIRVAKHLLATSGRSIAAVTAAETAASIYIGLRALKSNLTRMRTPLLLPPPPQPEDP